MTSTSQKHKGRTLKAGGVRRKLRRHTTRPRLSVFRSLKNISVQVIDDLRGHTLAAASSTEKELRAEIKGTRKTDVAARVGKLLAERAKQQGVSKVTFDRGSYRYHGRVKALAEAAREGGLEF
ncbi:MAG: 50S ribosomal protein L18 [Planctomycetota bacterium]|nr:50S ribosomal protein L18 [Planctomycetota bacterium]